MLDPFLCPLDASYDVKKIVIISLKKEYFYVDLKILGELQVYRKYKSLSTKILKL